MGKKKKFNGVVRGNDWQRVINVPRDYFGDFPVGTEVVVNDEVDE